MTASVANDKKKIAGIDGKLELAVGDIVKTQGITKRITDDLAAD